ncbi:hypothetical protein DM01DRAFT_1128809 [Hesseltinella vesiculosa]|uniref:Uncharacterized protein n=1 Tax=Hesseltinella vesiculosa TaxID=101127 RepID=A0A1X2GUR4_9FUNG|nr:hypothetical protein DM01DRAFT_1128809 [Hesseltinella vesiculosa]
MVELANMSVAAPLLRIHCFATRWNLDQLTAVSSYFWETCYDDLTCTAVAPPSPVVPISQYLAMIDKSSTSTSWLFLTLLNIPISSYHTFKKYKIPFFFFILEW